MGMVLCMVALSDANLQRLLEDPPLVWQAIAPDEPEFYEQARTETSKGGRLMRLFSRATPTPPAPDLALTPQEGLTTDLDKAWQGLHYLFTGTASEGDPPGNFLVSGGREVGDIEVGYGPARVLTAKETQAARDWLKTIDEDELRRRFDPEDMTEKEIYPEIWTRYPETDNPQGYLMEYDRILRGFLNQVVDQGLGLVVYLS